MSARGLRDRLAMTDAHPTGLAEAPISRFRFGRQVLGSGGTSLLGPDTSRISWPSQTRGPSARQQRRAVYLLAIVNIVLASRVDALVAEAGAPVQLCVALRAYLQSSGMPSRVELCRTRYRRAMDS
jgi:hypothetical protein